MQEHKHSFLYRGKELIIPLSELIEFLKELEKVTRDEIIGFDTSKFPKTIVGIVGEPQQLYMRAESRHKAILADIVKAENWLRECRRTPRVKWSLDFIELEWLYRPKRIYVKPA